MSGFTVNPESGLWTSNAVLNGRNSWYITEPLEGTLSIKSVLSGEGKWITPSAEYHLDPSRYVILNSGQTYSVEIRSRDVVETFCVFFKPGFMHDADEGLKRKWDELLEHTEAGDDPGFYELLNLANDSVGRQLQVLQTLVRREQTSGLEAEQALLRVAEAMLTARKEQGEQRDSLDHAKAATREEVYRRLSVARDYMITHLDQPLALEEIATNSNLSPFHFHRLFKAAFKETPHAFVSSLRVERAKHLLARSKLSMTEVAWAIGFETQAAFSKFFSSAVGMTPTVFRSLNRI